MTNVEEHLRNLIRIPSTSSLSNRPVVDYARAVLEQAGWNCVLDGYADGSGTQKFNLIAAPAGQDADEPEVELVFLCHTDTVPPASDWERALDPFEEEGQLHGCGACDVKGFLACLLTAASANPRPKAGLRIVLTADEEVGCLGSHRLASQGRLRPNKLIIGEPTSLHAARAGKGYCLGELVVYGAEAHSAHPQRGRSAIFAAARIIQAIEHLAGQLEQDANPFFDPPHTTINIGTIRGGTAKNVIPGECRFLVEWRPVPGTRPEAVPDGIARVLHDFNFIDPALQATFTILRQQQAFETPADASLVTLFEQITGKRSVAIPFGSEASVFAALAEEIVVFGPGDMRTAHSPRECVPVAELQAALQVVTRMMTAN